MCFCCGQCPKTDFMAHNMIKTINFFPAGATDKTDTTWDGKNGVRSIRVSPDGEHLASGDRQGNVRSVTVP